VSAESRLVSGLGSEDEQQFEAGLRPRRLADFTGQARLKENLQIAIDAARQRKEAMDHVLLYGPPGLGKTTLGAIIAQELEVPFTQTSGPVLQKKLDLSGILSGIQHRQVFFIDEIHRHFDRDGAGGADAFDSAAEVHGDRGDDAAGAGERSDAGALWAGAAAEPLRCG